MSTVKILLFAVLFVSIVLLILFYDRIRKMKVFRSDDEKAVERAARKAAQEEEYFRRTSQKHYRKGEPKPEDFDKDYFKSTNEETAKNRTEKNTARQTTSSDGITIIDERQQTEEAAFKEKKIFNDGEGEYVEYEEV